MKEINESHTNIELIDYRSLPFKCRVIDNEIIISEYKEHEELLGNKIISINNIKIENIISKKISFGINKYTFEFENNQIITYNYNDNNIKNFPIKKKYYFKIINNILVIIYDKCSEDKNYKISEFVNDLKNLTNYDNIVLDIRNNIGGSSSAFQPIKEFIKSKKEEKNIACLVGENTFSSAIFALIEMRFMPIPIISENNPILDKYSYGNTSNFTFPDIENRFSVSKMIFHMKDTDIIDYKTKEEAKELYKENNKLPKEDIKNKNDLALLQTIEYLNNPNKINKDTKQDNKR